MFSKKKIDFSKKTDRQLYETLVESTVRNEKNIAFIADYLGIILFIIVASMLYVAFK